MVVGAPGIHGQHVLHHGDTDFTLDPRPGQHHLLLLIFRQWWGFAGFVKPSPRYNISRLRSRPWHLLHRPNLAHDHPSQLHYDRSKMCLLPERREENKCVNALFVHAEHASNLPLPLHGDGPSALGCRQVWILPEEPSSIHGNCGASACHLLHCGSLSTLQVYEHRVEPSVAAGAQEDGMARVLLHTVPRPLHNHQDQHPLPSDRRGPHGDPSVLVGAYLYRFGADHLRDLLPLSQLRPHGSEYDPSRD